MNQLKETKVTPLVSIVMCTYNGEKFIREQLRSIINQTYPNLEIIISDDNSSDGSYRLLEDFAVNDPRIILMRNEQNLGFTKNFSLACSKATGEYISISDQDDVWHKEKISRMIQGWKSDVPLMYCNSVRFKENIPVNAVHDFHYRRFEGKDGRKLAVFNTISGHALMVTKPFLEGLLPFREKLMYDWYAGVTAAYNGGVGYLPDILVYQREHTSNISIGKGFDHKDKKYKHIFNKMVSDHLAAFSEVKNIPEEDAQFFNQFSIIWQEAINKKFSQPLFLFLLKYRKIIFWYKHKKINIFSQIKHSYKLASN